MRELRRARIETGVSLRALAQRTGLTYGYLSKVERDRANPTVATLQRIHDALHVPTRYETAGERLAPHRAAVKTAWRHVIRCKPSLLKRRPQEGAHVSASLLGFLLQTMDDDLADEVVGLDKATKRLGQGPHGIRALARDQIVDLPDHPADSRRRRVRLGAIGWLLAFDELGRPEGAGNRADAYDRFMLKAGHWLMLAADTGKGVSSTLISRFEVMVSRFYRRPLDRDAADAIRSIPIPDPTAVIAITHLLAQAQKSAIERRTQQDLLATEARARGYVDHANKDDVLASLKPHIRDLYLLWAEEHLQRVALVQRAIEAAWQRGSRPAVQPT